MGGGEKKNLHKKGFGWERNEWSKMAHPMCIQWSISRKENFFFSITFFLFFSLIVLISPATFPPLTFPHVPQSRGGVCTISEHNNNNFRVRLDFAFGGRWEFYLLGERLCNEWHVVWIFPISFCFVFIYIYIIYYYYYYYYYFGIFIFDWNIWINVNM